MKIPKHGNKIRSARMRIAVFGGSFDPPHIEHIRLAEAAVKELRLDTLFVMPAHTPPHKPWKQLAKDEHRLEMCRLAFSRVENVQISDYEMSQGGTSYTYLTCRHFKEMYPDAEIFWLVGTDMLRDFPTWKNPDEILSYVTLAVCGRSEAQGWVEQEQEIFKKRFGKEFVWLQYNASAVSSTKIRVLAGAGMRLTSLTTEKVEEFILKNGLYAVRYAKDALALEKQTRVQHSLRVAELAAARAYRLKIPERKAVEAALFHDCAKNLAADSPWLQGFAMPNEWGDVPAAVAHQFQGAYVAQKLGVTDEDVLNAVRYHTSARPNMSELEKLIFLADMLEEERAYDGVDELRRLFWKGDGLDECLEEALFQTLEFLKTKGGAIYALTQEAYDFYAKKNEQ